VTEPTFRARIRAYYESQSLPEDRLERLRTLARTSPPVGRRRLAIAGLAAGVLGIAAVALLIAGDASRSSSDVAREIARNHAKRKEPEIRVTSYEEIGGRMSRLDFTIVKPRAPQAERLRLVGARYCSLKGCIAAQFSLVAEDGRAHTLYEVRDGPAFSAVTPARVEVDGVEVHVWREGGILFGLASSVD
jgi:hypothetical protein